MSATELVAERDALTEVSEAREEHREAVAAWRQLEKDEQELKTAHVLKAGASAVRFDPVEAELERHRIFEERPQAAARLQAARTRLAHARVAYANEKLPSLVVAYTEVAEEVETRVRKLEEAVALAIAAARDLEDARQDERRLMEPVVNAALAGCLDNDRRSAIAADAHIKLPISLNAEGVADWIRRPIVRPFGGDPRHPRWWEQLGRHAGRTKVPEKLAHAIEKAQRKS